VRQPGKGGDRQAAVESGHMDRGVTTDETQTEPVKDETVALS
jgi:hypothetical protein